MHAVIFADRPGAALAPLTDDTCAALLPMADTPLLVHAIEAVAAAGIRSASIVAGPFADAVEALVGDGARWGVQAAVVLAGRGEAPDAVLARLRPRLLGDVLVLRGDVLRGADLADFIARAAAVTGDSVAARIDGTAAGVRLVRAGAPTALGLLGDPEDGAAWRETAPAVELAGAVLSRCESLAAYHRANLDAAAGRVPHLLLPARESSPGVRLGMRARIAAADVRATPLFVGARSELKRGVELLGEVVVSHDVVVDRRASLHHAVILPHSYVGELVAVHDAIVCTDRLIDAATGTVTHVVDSFLLADLRGRQGGGPLRRGVDRLLGAALLLLSLPLWPLALLLAVVRAPRAPLRRVRLCGNRLEPGNDGRPRRAAFTAVELATRAPVLRHLPRLLAVVRGDLRLIGVTPLTPAAAAAPRDPWEQVRDRAPVGLVGPAQLAVAADAPVEERVLAEAYYARTRSARGDAALLLRGLGALCSRRAWHGQLVAHPT